MLVALPILLDDEVAAIDNLRLEGAVRAPVHVFKLDRRVIRVVCGVFEPFLFKMTFGVGIERIVPSPEFGFGPEDDADPLDALSAGIRHVTDQLKVGPVAVSQVLSGVLVILCFGLILRRRKHR